jgi:hypothetical protein
MLTGVPWGCKVCPGWHLILPDPGFRGKTLAVRHPS